MQHPLVTCHRQCRERHLLTLSPGFFNGQIKTTNNVTEMNIEYLGSPKCTPQPGARFLRDFNGLGFEKHALNFDSSGAISIKVEF